MNAIVRPLGERTRFKDQFSSDGFAAYSLTVTVSSRCFRRGSARRQKLRRGASNSLRLIVVSFILQRYHGETLSCNRTKTGYIFVAQRENPRIWSGWDVANYLTNAGQSINGEIGSGKRMCFVKLKLDRARVRNFFLERCFEICFSFEESLTSI